jgi:CRISPR/Cas system-associated endonuclease Cas3-HD
MVIDNVSKFKDKNLSLAAVFHDIAKPECLSIKNGQPTAYGHEFMSANVAKKYRNLIEDMGADYNEVIGLILNHMKMHNYNSGKLKKIHKIKQIEELPYFEKLKLFSKADSDRGDHSVS